MAKPAKRIPLKALLHLTFCNRCSRVRPAERATHLCDGCIITEPRLAAEAAREFVAKEREPMKRCRHRWRRIQLMFGEGRNEKHECWCERCGAWRTTLYWEDIVDIEDGGYILRAKRTYRYPRNTKKKGQ